MYCTQQVYEEPTITHQACVRIDGKQENTERFTVSFQTFFFTSLTWIVTGYHKNVMSLFPSFGYFFLFFPFVLILRLYFASFCILSSESCGHNLGISWQPLEPFVVAGFHHPESSNPNVPSLPVRPLENTIEFNVEINYNLGHRSEAFTPIHFPCFNGRKTE